MSLEQLIENYGYIVVILGTFLEGETILVLAGIAAKLGYLQLYGVVLAAFVGSLTGDQIYFFVGRRHGSAFLARRPNWQIKAAKIHALLERHHIAVVLGFRFMYGLRTVAPFVIGMSRIPTIRFLILNMIGAMLWAMVVGGLSFLFGHGLEMILGKIKRYELELFGFIAIGGIALWSINWCRGRCCSSKRS